MSWQRAEPVEALGRLAFGPSKGAVETPYATDASSNFAPGAAVQPVTAFQSAFADPMLSQKARQNVSAPVWGGESGYGPLTEAQRNYMYAINSGNESGSRLPIAGLNWSQTAPSFTENAPEWATGLLNQSAYNTAEKLTDSVPQFYDLPGYFTRGDTEVLFSTQDPGSRWLAERMGVTFPEQVLGDDWYGILDTTRENWWDPHSNALRFEYNPQETNDLGEFLSAAGLVLGGAGLISGLAGASFLGDLGSSLSGAFGSNAGTGLTLPASFGGSGGGIGLQMPASFGGTSSGIGLSAPASFGGAGSATLSSGGMFDSLGEFWNNPLVRAGRSLISNNFQSSQAADAAQDIQEEVQRARDGIAADAAARRAAASTSSASQGALGQYGSTRRGRQFAPLSLRTYRGAGPFGSI